MLLRISLHSYGLYRGLEQNSEIECAILVHNACSKNDQSCLTGLQLLLV
jgi:hypothetical protein